MLKGLRKRLATIFTVFTGVVLAAVLGVSFYQSVQQTIYNREMWFSSTVDRVTGTVMSNAMGEEQTSIVVSDYVIQVVENGKPVEGLLSASNADGTTAAQPVTEEERQAIFEEAKLIAEEMGLTDWIANSYQIFSTSVMGGVAVEADEGHLVEENESYQSKVSMEAQAEDSGIGLIEGSAIAITISPVLGTEGVFNLEYEDVNYRATYFAMTMPGVQDDAADRTYEIAIAEDLSLQTRQIWMDGLWYLGLLLAGLALLFLANWFLAKLVLRPTAESLRRQTEFVAAASHELRSPLAVIRSSLSAAQSVDDAQDVEKFQNAAAEEAERMSHLVDDLLLLAGGDAGSWHLQKEPVELDTLLIDASEVYRPLVKEKQVKLCLDLPDTALPKVQGAAERLRQILAILLDNALQYAPGGTSITMRAAARKGKVVVEVADQGCGIPDEEKGRVFERFYRADKSRHDKAHFGLGLSVAKELAELHGGNLYAEDTKGGGATFTLVLPEL